jgi:AbrB family looped-hinge helix DNA binding protein
MDRHVPDITAKFSAKVDKGGRIILPAALRKLLELEAGDNVILRVEDGDRVRLTTMSQTMREIHELARSVVRPGDTLVSEEFIEQKRREAAKENAEFDVHADSA